MASELDTTTLVALIVSVAVIVVGLLVLMKQQKPAKTPKVQVPGPGRGAAPGHEPRPQKMPVKTSPLPESPALTKKVATGTGSVRTPAGRRSARLARKNLEHND